MANETQDTLYKATYPIPDNPRGHGGPVTGFPTPEGILRRDHIALMLLEDGPYSVTKRPDAAFITSDASAQRAFVADLTTIGNLLSANNLTEIRQVLTSSRGNERVAAQVNKRALEIYFDREEIGGLKEDQRLKKMREYGETADSYITEYMRQDVWEPLSGRTSLREAVQGTHDIPDLLRLVFESKSPRIRFEAKRKIVLMTLAASIDARINEQREQSRYKKFTQFLTDHVWYKNPDGTTPERKIDLLSKHDYDTYRVIAAEELPQDGEADRKIANHSIKRGGAYLRKTPLDQSFIEHNGEMIPVFREPRQKKLHSRMGKMIRKGIEDPALGVQDSTGLLMIVRNRRDAYKLFKHIVSGGKSTQSLKVEEFEDTLGREPYSARNKGSSQKTRQLKFIARQGGSLVEVVIHTYDSYLDYQHQDEVAHEEYEINRYEDSAAFQLLFPEKIYGIKPDEVLGIIDNQRRHRRLPQF